jgi:hypothetical protein
MHHLVALFDIGDAGMISVAVLHLVSARQKQGLRRACLTRKKGA